LGTRVSIEALSESSRPGGVAQLSVSQHVTAGATSPS